ncbi:MAG: penicillin-binding protein 2 [Treponema sp.]|jgi:penicillin-binding protein 2|nr:penicillin-binding protein 2 [Treponema sp.]
MMPPDGNARHGKSESRIVLLRTFFVVLFVIYGLRLFNMQILSGEQYRSHAQDISRRTEVLPSQRGEIFDRSYTQALALNTDSFAVSIVPAEVPRGHVPELIANVASIINVPASEIEAKIPPRYYHLYQPVEVAVNVPFQLIAVLAERRDALPGVLWNNKPVRNYAELGSLSHIVGYVGDITRDELTQLHNYGYQQGDVIGKTGIERQYDALLKGKDGRETRTVDVRGMRVAGQGERIPPGMGKNLVLTIDRRIQTLVEQSLGQRIGAAVVMRPATGEILALVSYPWYDPNIFTRGDRGVYQTLATDPNKPFLNRAIQSSYPPASSFKIVMTTGILAESAFPPERTILCPGEIDYGNRQWRCHVRRPGHGWLNLHRAMAQSCDIYYWQVGRDNLGVERIVSYAQDYGFGAVTGIDLPGEIAGFVPTPQWKNRRFHEKWLGGDTMNMSIGQGFTLVTPIQMANMVAMVVNNGKIYQPYLLKEVRDPVSGAVEQMTQPTLLHESDVDPKIFEHVRRDMRGVVSEGTAQFPLNLSKITQIAGKTGTAEVGLQDRWHSWFASYAPYAASSPEEQIVVSIIVEAVNPWEWWAPYASAIIFQGIFANQNFDDAVQSLGLRYIVPVQGRRE